MACPCSLPAHTALGLPAGTARVACNTFRVSPPINRSRYGIVLGLVPLGHGQIDITTGPPVVTGGNRTTRLQTNAFEGTTPTNADTTRTGNVFWHVYNHYGNAPITYGRYGNKDMNVPYDVPNDLDALERHVGPNDNTTTQVVLVSPSSIRLGPGNDCSGGVLPNTGLQRSGGPIATPPVAASPRPIGPYLQQNTPNPCSGSTAIAYRVPNAESTARLLVRDAYSGRPRLEQPLASGEHNITLDVQSLPPGIYVYTLEIDGRSVANHKLLVQ